MRPRPRPQADTGQTGTAPAVPVSTGPGCAPETETGPETAAGTETAPRDRSRDRGRSVRAFYLIVLVVALVGSSTGARDWLFDGPTAGWHLPAAFAAVAVYELGAVCIARFADQRRRIGERAAVARTVSAALAGGAIAAQYYGHDGLGPQLFFAGVSATGYAVYLLEAAAARRDALRREGKLAATPPAYGPLQWLGQFGLTRRARALALASAEANLVDPAVPVLGRVASLQAAAEQVRAQRRLAAINVALRQRITAGADPVMATIAVNTYDLQRVAQGVAAGADYAGLVHLITADLAAHLAATGTPVAAAPAPGPPPVVEPAAVSVAALPGPETARTGPETESETAETGPETGETGPETGETAVPEAGPAPVGRVPLTTLPPPLTTLINGNGRPGETAPRRPVPDPPTGPKATETEPADTGTELGETGETGPETAPHNEGDPLAGIDAKLLPYLVKIVDVRRDWAVAVNMPPKHPDALSTSKIKEAAQIGGKQLGCDLRTALIALSKHPETAQAALRSRGLATNGAR